MQLEFLACLTEKFHRAYSPYALNELHLVLTQMSTTWKKFKILSFYLR